MQMEGKGGGGGAYRLCDSGTTGFSPMTLDVALDSKILYIVMALSPTHIGLYACTSIPTYIQVYTCSRYVRT